MDDKVELLVGAGGSIPSKWSQWNAESTYTPLRSVTHLGSSYVCKKACKGVDPEADVALGDGVEGEYWIKTASKGDKGDKGDRGIKGDSTEVTATEIEEGIQLDIKNTVYKEDGSAEETQKSTLVKHGNLQFPAGASVGDIVKIIQVKDGKPTKWMSIPFLQEFKNEVALLENSPIITSAEMKDRKTVRFKNAYAKKVFDLDATPLAFICNSFAEKGQIPVVDAVDENGDPTEWSTTDLPNGIDVTGGAAVGQIIQVSKVDSKGQPTEWKAVDLPSGTGGVSVPNGAKVGQIIQVSKVDSNGKPTEWKAIDLPSGTGDTGGIVLTLTGGYGNYSVMLGDDAVEGIDLDKELKDGRNIIGVAGADMRFTTQIGVDYIVPAGTIFRYQNASVMEMVGEGYEFYVQLDGHEFALMDINGSGTWEGYSRPAQVVLYLKDSGGSPVVDYNGRSRTTEEVIALLENCYNLGRPVLCWQENMAFLQSDGTTVTPPLGNVFRLTRSAESLFSFRCEQEGTEYVLEVNPNGFISYVGEVSGGGVYIPNGAAVGQIIQVSAVDESGQPTEWVATDWEIDQFGNSYDDLDFKPSINGVTLSGNKTSADLGIGDPTDAQVATAVDAWLDAHPEATTTVADGSITCDKIHDAVVYHQVFDLDDLLANYTLNSSNDAFIISPHWEVEPETLYTMNFYGTYTNAFVCYNENKVSLGSARVDATTGQFTTLANTKYITFQAYIGADKSVMATQYANAMICKGDALYTDFFVGKKYILSDLLLREMLSQLAEGVVDGAKIIPKTIAKNRLTPDFQIIPDEIKGINLKNLFNANDYAYSAEDTDNVKIGYPGSYGNASWRTLIVPCKPNTTYYLYLHNGTEAVEVSSYMRSSIGCYNANLESVGSVTLTDFAFTTPENTAFIFPWFLAQYESTFNSIVSEMMLTTSGVTDRYYPYTAEPEWLNLMAKKGTEELKVLCYGDSLTSGMYPSKVADLLSCKVVDAGVGGNTCASIAARVGNYGTDFDVVTLMVGTNDNGGQTSCPLGTADDEAATDDNASAAETTYASRLKRLLNKIKATHRGATFVIMPPFEHAWSSYEGLAALMEEIARQYKMPFLDIYHLCGWDGTDEEDKAIFMADGTHENAVGAQRIAELLAGFIKQLKGA